MESVHCTRSNAASVRAWRLAVNCCTPGLASPPFTHQGKVTPFGANQNSGLQKHYHATQACGRSRETENDLVTAMAEIIVR